MDISDLLGRDSLLLSVKATGMHDVFEHAATHLSYLCEQRSRHIVTALIAREERGTTALGGRVALPHARLEGLRQPHGVFLRFASAIPADAPDGEPVDIAFVLIAPESANAAYLRAVGKIATILRDPARRAILSHEEDRETLYDILTSEDA